MPPTAPPMKSTATVPIAAYARRVVNDATNSASVVNTTATARPDARNRGTTSQLSRIHEPVSRASSRFQTNSTASGMQATVAATVKKPNQRDAT